MGSDLLFVINVFYGLHVRYAILLRLLVDLIFGSTFYNGFDLLRQCGSGTRSRGNVPDSSSLVTDRRAERSRTLFIKLLFNHQLMS